MIKADLIASVAENCDLSKAKASKAVEAMIDSITDSLLNGDKVSITGIGTFYVSQRMGRAGRNPQTGKTIAIPPSKQPAIRFSSILKKRLN